MKFIRQMVWACLLLPVWAHAEFLDFCNSRYAGETEQIHGSGPLANHWVWERDCISKVGMTYISIFGSEMNIGMQVWRPGYGERGWILMILDGDSITADPKDSLVVTQVAWSEPDSDEVEEDKTSRISLAPDTVRFMDRFRPKGDGPAEVGISVAPNSWPRR